MAVSELRPPVAPAPLNELSPAERLALATPEERAEFFGSLTETEAAALVWEWEFWGRPDQIPPDDGWTICGICGGRGMGKTRAGAEWTRKKARTGEPGVLVGATPRDVRDFMLDGPSGILTISPPHERPTYEPSKLLLTWPNGNYAHVRSAADPESIRGASSGWMWADEWAKWRYLRKAWDNCRFALREGAHPQTVITTTPQTVPLVRDLLAGRLYNSILMPRVTTYRNAANVSPDWLAEMVADYEGTRTGRQELHGLLLEDVEGAMLTWALIEASRWEGQWTEDVSEDGLSVVHRPDLGALRKVVGVDPSGSESGDECGIIVCGASTGNPPIGFTLDDLSIRGTPEKWGTAAVDGYYEWGCTEMVAETNFGAEMVERVIRTIPETTQRPSGQSVRFTPVRAGKGQDKASRAAPVVGMFEQNARGMRRLYHVGNFPELEAQWCTWVPPTGEEPSSWSPDRLDAEVWALTHLLVLHSRRPARSGAATLLGG